MLSALLGLRKRLLPVLVLGCFALTAVGAEASQARKKPRKPAPQPAAAKPASAQPGLAEAKLIEIYKLIGQSNTRQALAKAEALVKEHPNFQLAQLVYGDLLTAQVRPVRAMGDVPEPAARQGMQMLAELRDESMQRMRALRERPPEGSVPSQFLQLSARNRHAIAVDTSRSRLYLFENANGTLRLIGDYYVSVGKLGIEKATEGDLRTPLGVYFITSNLDPKSLKDFYGAGALPINYPNPYDAKRGKTGSGIWLHGTPPTQFSRAPKATDGCVVLANPDLMRIVRTVEVRTTPVVIAHRLQWVPQQGLEAEGKRFAEVLHAWKSARQSGDVSRILSFYAPDFSGNGKSLAEWRPVLQSELDRIRGRALELKDVSYMRWVDSAETMVVTFGEVAQGSRGGAVKRQYWVRQGPQWKIFFEGVIG